MDGNGESSLRIQNGAPSSIKERLADFLTLSRGIIGLAILSLSFIGKDAYITVVILTLIGATTDIFDGKAARRYLKNRESKLGKHDVEVDTLFVLCVIGYLSLSGIVIPKVVGLAWIGLALIAIVLYKRKLKVLFTIEISSVLALIAIAGLYDFKLFISILLPVILAGTIINHKRVLYLVFEYIPKTFSEK